MYKVVKKQIGNNILTIETGKIARQADGAVVVHYGDSTILATVCVSKNANMESDFLPLTVEYREKSYAIGKIPGNFFRREGRPNTKEILSSRLIDRPLRPLFPRGFTHEIQLMVNVLSSDQENDQDIIGVIGASAACAISPVPLKKFVSAVGVGYVNGEYVINPTFKQLTESEIDIIVAGSGTDILMVEGNCAEVSETIMTGALEFARTYINEICELQKEFAEGISKEKMEFEPVVPSEEMISDIKVGYSSRIKDAALTDGKMERKESLDKIYNEIIETFNEKYPEQKVKLSIAFDDVYKQIVRDLILTENTRVDKRKPTDIRNITCEVGILPRTHGSALFTRGETQSLGVLTLGTKLDERLIEDLEGTSYKSYMLDYNFLPFSVGEARPLRGLSRREVGHGNLAEMAISPIIPHDDVFPYTIRIVSDILESNGSSSMATVCSGSLSLMDAGVPVKTAVAGIAMGLVTDGQRHVILSDILGDEDHFGDMDFKVAGTSDGITAFQMDIKIDGLTTDIISEALDHAKAGRFEILRIMNETISAPRENLSKYAPRILTIKIDVDKIGAVIGQGGKVIKSIQEQTGTTINIEDDGTVQISSVDLSAGEAAKAMVEAIVEDVEVGKIYSATVKRIVTFGAFVEILPGKEGLVHISELDKNRVEKVEDVLNIGDKVMVKVIGLDNHGKIKCSRKAAL